MRRCESSVRFLDSDLLRYCSLCRLDVLLKECEGGGIRSGSIGLEDLDVPE